jgi:hypothetical protein
VIVYKGSHLIHYGQVGIWSAGDPQAYPPPFGPLPWKGPKGVVVPALEDAHVDVTVILSKPVPTSDQLHGCNILMSCDIEVGNDGLEVGNITTASTEQIEIKKGLYHVSGYYSGEYPSNSIEWIFVMFFIKNI